MVDREKDASDGDQEPPFGLFELGSNSLKFYRVTLEAPAPRVETTKFPWRVAHEFYAGGAVSSATLDSVVAHIRDAQAPGGVAANIDGTSRIAIATGVFRELAETPALAARVKAETATRIRVISGRDEAKLMARGFPRPAPGSSVCLVDLGGATTEWAWIDADGRRDCGSIPLGAIRLSCALTPWRDDPARYLSEATSRCDAELDRINVRGQVELVGVGGTAKAVAASAGARRLSASELHALVERVQRDGAPESLGPERRAVFLPGLLILWRLAIRCRSETFTYGSSSVRDGMVSRLVGVLAEKRREDLRATMLLRSTILPPAERRRGPPE